MSTREHHYRLNLEWTGFAQGPTTSYQAYSREYLVQIDGKPPLKGSADPTFRGDPALHNPEDLLVAALASCHMLSFLSEATRAGVVVVRYRDEAEGLMTFEAGGFQFSRVTLHPRVVVAAGTDTEVVARLHHKAHESCFIARSVNFPVEHEAIAYVAVAPTA
jgi:organic hydroperoxide reductase OsmC/OhrA